MQLASSVRRLPSLERTGQIPGQPIAFSPNGKKLLTGVMNWPVMKYALYDLYRTDHLVDLQMENVGGICFAPDSESVVARGPDCWGVSWDAKNGGAITLWDVQTGQRKQEIDTGGNTVFALASNANCASLLACYRQDGVGMVFSCWGYPNLQEEWRRSFPQGFFRIEGITVYTVALTFTPNPTWPLVLATGGHTSYAWQPRSSVSPQIIAPRHAALMGFDSSGTRLLWRANGYDGPLVHEIGTPLIVQPKTYNARRPTSRQPRGAARPHR